MIVHYAFTETSLGEVLIASDEQGLCFMGFTEENRAEALEDLERRIKPASLVEDKSDQWITQVHAWLSAGMIGEHHLPLSLHGTPFQVAVWKALLEIPYGTVVSYQAIARAIGRPKAVRAVGTAIGRNNLSILIPCHRVLTTSGGIGGYRWGIARKQRLLEQEGIGWKEL